MTPWRRNRDAALFRNGGTLHAGTARPKVAWRLTHGISQGDGATGLGDIWSASELKSLNLNYRTFRNQAK
uniref:Uncharacterized protein n=1 Tax=Setaria viridis TaxID=4556 RepID=A0A4V6D0R7_SETVI|nr:hypothetical protein SEVIR_9G126601v2 [Setaria viridis]